MFHYQLLGTTVSLPKQTCPLTSTTIIHLLHSSPWLERLVRTSGVPRLPPGCVQTSVHSASPFFFCFLWLPSREWGNYSRTCASYSHFPLKREKYNNLVNCFCLACFLQNSPINIPFTSRDAVIQVFLHWFWLWKVWKWHQCFPQIYGLFVVLVGISCRSSKFCWWRQSPVLDCLLEVLVLACSLRSVI